MRAEWGDEILAFLLSASCPGCDEPATLLCDECRRRLAPVPLVRTTRRGLDVHAALAYEEVPARCIRLLKSGGATLLARPLGAALGAVMADAVPADALVVPVPTTPSAFRRRGYRVPELLVRRAGFVPVRVLRTSRRIGDQRALGAEERAENVAASMRVRGEPAPGTRVVLVDDVVTTGATLDEASRALEDAGMHPIRAFALAATPRRDDTRKPIVNG